MSASTISAATHSAPHITGLTIEHFTGDAIGVGVAEPHLTWTYAPDVGSLDGRTVTVRALRGPLGIAPAEEIAHVPATSNAMLAWPFRPLGPLEQARISVRLDPQDANESRPTTLGQGIVAARACMDDPWSEERVIEQGLTDVGLRVADMIGPAWPEPWSDYRQPARIRTECAFAERPVAARLYCSAYGLVEAEINGRRVGEDILTPGWTSYQHRLQCRAWDVTDMLREGSNAMGFWLGDGWYRGRLGFQGGKPNVYGDRLGLFAQLVVFYADGRMDMVVSNSYDLKWKAKRSPIVISGLYEGECYDARLDEDGWSEPGFDDSDGWERVTELDFDPLTMQAPAFDPVRCSGENPVRSITKLGDGSYMVDVGQNCSQRFALDIPATQIGHEISIQHAEVLNPDGTLALEPLRRAEQRDVYISDGHAAHWEPRFTIHGFRYARVDGWPGELTADMLHCRVYGSVMRRTGWLETSDEMVNRLHDNIVWSMRSNFVSIPTDCPQRDERLGWTGDIAVFAPTAAFLFDTAAFLSNWLEDVEYETREFGTVPLYVPFIPLMANRTPECLAIWGDSAVLVPWALYQESGDTALLARQYPLARAWVEQVIGKLSDDGVWDYDPADGRGQLGDWLDPTAPAEDPTRAMTDRDLVATAYLINSLRLVARMADDLGKAEDSARYTTYAERSTKGYIARYVTPDGVMTSDTQCAYALSIAFGIFDGDNRLKAIAGDRLAELVREGGYHVGTGFAGTPHVLPALSETGHSDVAFKLFMSRENPSWLYQVAMGATTTWERWDSMLPDGSVNTVGNMTSFNHYSLGSVGAWMHRTIGGLNPVEPGWRRFEIAPVPGGGIDRAHITHDTPHGRIDVAWRLDGESIIVDATVPEGTLATVRVGDGEELLDPGNHSVRLPLHG